MIGFLQGLLLHVVQHQPEDPIGYFHEEITKIKKEMEETNVSIFYNTGNLISQSLALQDGIFKGPGMTALKGFSALVVTLISCFDD